MREPSRPFSPIEDAKRTWKQAVAAYQSPDLRRSIWQLANSLVPFLALWYLAYRLLAVSYWLTLATDILAAGFLVRVFIIFHDCGHGSFFSSKAANDTVGFITGVFTLTPYYEWRHEHALHHATAGDLDRRGRGDVWTMTVSEYRAASFWQRLGYRLYRNPLVMFGVGPLYVFLLKQRLPRPGSEPRERLSVHLANLALTVIIAALTLAIGLKAVLLVHLPIMLISGAAGVWLFYVQHQFEEVYWQRSGERDYVDVALKGSSLFALPRVLQWFSGNIGFHHIHHLSPRIPNYRLEKCYREQPLFQDVDRITLLGSLRTLRLRLYDEQSQRLVGFGALRAGLDAQPTAST
jgi:omega-6 fatty acid desaturase (delta-12 desaturase)